MKLLVFDVETAAADCGSICSIGWMLYNNDKLVNKGYSLINPHCTFSKTNVKIHGITENDVSDAPSFIDYWDTTLSTFASSAVFAAHNARFDVSCVIKAITDAGRDIPGFYYLDTLPLFRHYLESDSYKLSELANQLGFDYHAHNALEDVEALTRLMFFIRDRLEFSDLAEMFLCSPVRCENTLNDDIPKQKSLPQTFKTLSHCTEDVEIISDRFAGMRFCLTGDPPGYERADIEKLIMERSGRVTNSVSGKTNYLVVGKYELYGDDYISTKHQTALDMIEKGKPIQIISTDEFFNMLNQDA